MKLFDNKADAFYIDAYHIAVVYLVLHVSQVQFQGVGNLLGWANCSIIHSIQHYTDQNGVHTYYAFIYRINLTGRY